MFMSPLIHWNPMDKPRVTIAASTGNQVIYFGFVVLLSSPGCAAPVSETFTVSVEPHVSVQRGHTAVLPCWLTPSQSAEDMEIRWNHGSDEYDAPILLYQAKSYSSQKASYAGRVSLGLKEETSDGLKAGDVSLKLQNVTIEDVGTYKCYVSSSHDHGGASINLSVTETGRSPLLSAVMKDDKVNMSCQSDGWYPKPELSWSDSKKTLTPANVSFSKNPAGFYSVHSWVLVSSPCEVSCSVGLFNETPKEARMCLENPPPLQEEKECPSDGWVAFGTLLAVVLVGLGVWCFLHFRKKDKSKSGDDTNDATELRGRTEENEPLLPTATWQSAAQLEASKYYENVQLVDTSNERITIQGSTLRENIGDTSFNDADRVTCLTAVRGSPGFSSGRHYWEVSLEISPEFGLKKSWWIGVTDKHEIPHDASFPPTTKNGFWFLSSSPNQNTLHFSTKPGTFIYVQSKPKTVGVYLDFDNRELSFYNVEENCLIGSLVAKFTAELFPLFNPGIGDLGKMEILQRAVQDQSNNTESVEQKEQED